YKDPLLTRLHQVRDSQDDMREALVRRIPFNESVIASFDFLSHLSNRDGVYAFYNIWLGKNLLTKGPYYFPRTVKYALIDLEDPWLKTAYADDPKGVGERVDKFLQDGWIISSRSRGILLLHRSEQ
ncbi:MAG: hypothetical protein HQL22_11300, partial [Candidatus Omnitrophica bacterium]|nr:hypothetical protein [Candidatus Omnitrophota bacterium]